MGSILRIGGEFAGYRIDALIGRGGMSEVYRAENPRLEKKVAIKVLSAELAGDQLFHERFLRESRMAASLEHPHVLPIFDAGEENGVPYIVMRYIEGPDLKELVEREGRLSLERVVTIIEQVGGALDSAHAKGLVHRDVKPANVLIDGGTNGSGDHAFLSDFGVAKHSLTASGLTHTGHFVGTIDYVSPEQIEGKELDGRTDVYSLGCVLYESLAGIPPFDRDSNVAMIYAHLLDAPPAISDQRIDLPAPIDAIVAKALSKDREERFQTCGALAAELRRAAAPAAEATRAAGSTPLMTRLSEPAGAAPATVLAAGAATAVPAPDTSAAAAPSPPTRRSDPEQGVTTPRRTGFGRRPLLIGIVAVALIAAAAAGATLIHSSGKKSTTGATSDTKQTKTTGKTGDSGKAKGKAATAVDQATMKDVYGGPGQFAKNRRKLSKAQNSRVRQLLLAHRPGAAKRFVRRVLANQKAASAKANGRRRGAQPQSSSASGGDRRRGASPSSSTSTTTTSRRRGGTSSTTPSSTNNRRRGASQPSTSSSSTGDRRRR